MLAAIPTGNYYSCKAYEAAGPSQHEENAGVPHSRRVHSPRRRAHGLITVKRWRMRVHKPLLPVIVNKASIIGIEKGYNYYVKVGKYCNTHTCR